MRSRWIEIVRVAKPSGPQLKDCKTDASLVFSPKAGFAMASDRCSKAHRFGPAHQHLRTSPVFQSCRALSLALIVFIQYDPESFRGCDERQSGSRLEIQFHILP